MIATTIEQSKKLLGLGIDSSTADMYWWSTSLRSYIESMDDGDFNEEEGHIRAWSLSALLNILPFPILSRDVLGLGLIGWRVTVYINESLYDSWFYDNPISACIEMIIKLKKQKLL